MSLIRLQLLLESDMEAVAVAAIEYVSPYGHRRQVTSPVPIGCTLIHGTLLKLALFHGVNPTSSSIPWTKKTPSERPHLDRSRNFRRSFRRSRCRRFKSCSFEMGGFAPTVCCAAALDFCPRHVTGPMNNVPFDHVVRAAHQIPVANRRPQRNRVPIEGQLLVDR